MLKDRTIFAFIEGFHMPHRQSSLIEGRIFHIYITFPIKPYQSEEDPTEVVVRRYYIKKVYLEISPNLQENTCARELFSKNTFFHRTHPLAAFDPAVG